ncbi:MAG TPA: hypothetical protein VIY72_16595 [Acidimicrobiales bacterium]
MLATVTSAANFFAGISWTPGIRGILTVVVGVAVLMGSVYLLLATNIGARLGLLVALAGLFGFLSIIAFIWWLQPPAIGPKGNSPRWEVVEIYVNDGEPALTAELERLISPDELPTADEILAAHPELAEEYPNGFVLSDLQANNPEILEEFLPGESLDGWRVTAASSAGEAQAAADVILVETPPFTATTDYKKLNTFEYGGKPRRADACDDGDMLCRAKFRVERLFTFWDNPVHYAVVQVQPVIPQETQPGEAPPIPVVDPSQPVYSVVMVRDLGDVRLIPFLYFVISLSLFIIFAWVLHNREKTLLKNMAMAEAVRKGD